MPQPIPATGDQPKRRFGINENLAREILELHTLGVDGGYRQEDVTSFAQIITGWSIGESRLSAGPQTSVDNNADVQSLPAGGSPLYAFPPARRWGDPQDLAGPITFLASQDADYITGSVLVVDGGQISLNGVVQ